MSNVHNLLHYIQGIESKITSMKKYFKITFHNLPTLMAVGTKEDWDVPVISIEEKVHWILELFIELFLSCLLATRIGSPVSWFAP